MRWWQWLVAQGLYRDLLATVTALIVGRVLAWRPLREIRRQFRQHQEGQARIADLLDTSTPGGLAELLPEHRRHRRRDDQDDDDGDDGGDDAPAHHHRDAPPPHTIPPHTIPHPPPRGR